QTETAELHGTDCAIKSSVTSSIFWRNPFRHPTLRSEATAWQSYIRRASSTKTCQCTQSFKTAARCIVHSTRLAELRLLAQTVSQSELWFHYGKEKSKRVNKH